MVGVQRWEAGRGPSRAWLWTGEAILSWVFLKGTHDLKGEEKTKTSVGSNITFENLPRRKLQIWPQKGFEIKSLNPTVACTGATPSIYIHICGLEVLGFFFELVLLLFSSSCSLLSCLPLSVLDRKSSGSFFTHSKAGKVRITVTVG